ncbi:MAG: zinc-binding dehydrogenase [Spirochaetota bacterium]
MKQIWISKAGGPESLELRDGPDPSLGTDDVLIQVRAAGVNFADVLARMGMYPDAPPIPCVVGYEVAGEVSAVGPGVKEFSEGDRVVALTRFGGYSSVVGVPRNQVFAMPASMGFAEAAAIPVNYFTAYLAVVRFGNLQPDERMLIHNAGGGVGIAAIQLGARIGAEIYGTASGWKHDGLRELGAHELVDYRMTDWEAEVLRLTANAGVHLIVDPIGGNNLKKGMRVLAPLGRLIAFGLSEPVKNGRRSLMRTLASLVKMPRPHFLSLLNNNQAIGGLNLGHLWTELDRLRVVGDAVLQAWNDGDIRPVIAAEIPFAEAGEAHRLLQDRENLGKVVLIP